MMGYSNSMGLSVSVTLHISNTAVLSVHNMIHLKKIQYHFAVKVKRRHVARSHQSAFLIRKK